MLQKCNRIFSFIKSLQEKSTHGWINMFFSRVTDFHGSSFKVKLFCCVLMAKVQTVSHIIIIIIITLLSPQESEGGLYLCMNSFLGFGSQYVDRHSARSGQRAYLHITRTRKSKVKTGLFFNYYFFSPLWSCPLVRVTLI